MLIERGHLNAWQYPLGLVSDEAALIVERENRRIASEAIALKSAAIAVWAEGGSKQFDELIASLMGGD